MFVNYQVKDPQIYAINPDKKFTIVKFPNIFLVNSYPVKYKPLNIIKINYFVIIIDC